MSAALKEFNSKWFKIDFLRLDKYIMLMDSLYEKFFSLKRIFNHPNVSYYKKLTFNIIENKNTNTKF